MIIIEIEIQKRNRIKEFFHRIYSKLEDIAFTVIQKLPEKFIPHWLMNWLDKYLDKRLNELKQQTIRQTWKKLSLEKVFDEISCRQHSK